MCNISMWNDETVGFTTTYEISETEQKVLRRCALSPGTPASNLTLGVVVTHLSPKGSWNGPADPRDPATGKAMEDGLDMHVQYRCDDGCSQDFISNTVFGGMVYLWAQLFFLCRLDQTFAP